MNLHEDERLLVVVSNTTANYIFSTSITYVNYMCYYKLVIQITNLLMQAFKS